MTSNWLTGLEMLISSTEKIANDIMVTVFSAKKINHSRLMERTFM